MSQLLIAIKSCRVDMDKGCHDVIRATWGQQFRGRALVRFFIGHQNKDYFMSHPAAKARMLQSDEVELDTPDDYDSLPYKTRAICRWAMSKNLDHIFLCDNDTYVYPQRLLTCGYDRYDYVGKISKPLGETFPYNAVDRKNVNHYIAECHPWASGGLGYFLSRDAARVVSDSYPNIWAEDLWVGQVMGEEIKQGNMLGLDLPAGAYSHHFPAHQYGQGYSPELKWMELMHATNQAVNG
jgi:hypothetical protein